MDVPIRPGAAPQTRDYAHRFEMQLFLTAVLAFCWPQAPAQPSPPPIAPAAPTAPQSAPPPAPNPVPATATPKELPGEAQALFNRADQMMGGREAFEAIRSVRLVMETVGSAGPVRIELRWCKEGGFSMRQTMSQRNADVESATNGRLAWHVNHATGAITSATPEQVDSPPEVAFVFDVLTPLRKMPWRECTVHHKHPFQGVLADVVTLHSEGESHIEVFFDPDRGIPLGTQRYTSLTEVPAERVIWTGWRQVGRLLLPTEREMTTRKAVTDLTFSVLEFDTLTLADFAPPSSSANPATTAEVPPTGSPSSGAAK